MCVQKKKKKKDVELNYLGEINRNCLVYFVTTRSNTLVSFIDNLTKKVLFVYSTGQACIAEEEREKEKQELEEAKALEESKKKLKKKSKKPLTRSQRKARKRLLMGIVKPTANKVLSITRAYRRNPQANRLLGLELITVFKYFLQKFKVKYKFLPKYRFLIYFKGYSKTRQLILKDFLKSGLFDVVFFGDVTQPAHNGCRLRKPKRTKLKLKPRKF